MLMDSLENVVWGTVPHEAALVGLPLFETTLREQLAVKIQRALDAGNVEAADFLAEVRGEHMAARVRMLVAWAGLAVAVVLTVRRPTADRKIALGILCVVTFWMGVSYARRTKRAAMIAADPGALIELEARLGLPSST